MSTRLAIGSEFTSTPSQSKITRSKVTGAVLRMIVARPLPEHPTASVWQAQDTSVMPQPFTAPRSKVIVLSHPATAAERSIRQSAKSALAP